MNLRDLSVAVLLAAGAAQAQDYRSMMQGMEQATAAASKSGDDKLTCEQLEEQLVAVVQDPEFLAHIESSGASAQKQQDAVEKAVKGQVAMQSLRTVLMSFIPGGAYGGMASAQSQAMNQGRQGMASMKDKMAQAQKMQALMPKLMRGQRVVELAAGKQCEWAAGSGM
jgi:hypothetical protein